MCAHNSISVSRIVHKHFGGCRKPMIFMTFIVEVARTDRIPYVCVKKFCCFHLAHTFASMKLNLLFNLIFFQPLNPNPDSRWNTYFKDNEILLQIDKDVRYSVFAVLVCSCKKSVKVCTLHSSI